MRRTHALGALAVAYAARRLWRSRSAISFANRVVVITGGSRGLGLVLARQFGREGAQIALIAEHDSPLDDAVMQLAIDGVDVQGIVCDVRQRGSVHAAINAVIDRFGRIDVIVNNAGVIEVGPLENMAYEDFQRAMDVHYWGALHVTFAALPHMRAAVASEGAAAPRIVNIASIGGRFPVPHLAPYTASKFALVGFSESLRAELSRDNIWVTTVTPGLMRTGSPRNISVKGNHEAEYAWFLLLDSLPFVSIGVERAAAQIIDAARHGDASLIITPQARLAAALEGISPGAVALLNQALTRWLLPSTPGRAGDASRRGRDVRPAWLPDAATVLTDRAAARNNELESWPVTAS